MKLSWSGFLITRLGADWWAQSVQLQGLLTTPAPNLLFHIFLVHPALIAKVFAFVPDVCT